EKGGHPRDRLLVAVAARVHLPRVADAEPEQEADVVGVREHACCIRCGDRVPAPDAGDPGCDSDALRRGQEDRRVRERLARAEPLRVPDRVVPELLDLARGPARLGGGRHRERADPDADAARLDRRRHESGLFALTSALIVSFTGAERPTSRAAGGIAPLITSISQGRPARTSSSIDGRAPGIASPNARAYATGSSKPSAIPRARDVVGLPRAAGGNSPCRGVVEHRADRTLEHGAGAAEAHVADQLLPDE